MEEAKHMLGMIPLDELKCISPLCRGTNSVTRAYIAERAIDEYLRECLALVIKEAGGCALKIGIEINSLKRKLELYQHLESVGHQDSLDAGKEEDKW